MDVWKCIFFYPFVVTLHLFCRTFAVSSSYPSRYRRYKTVVPVQTRHVSEKVHRISFHLTATDIVDSFQKCEILSLELSIQQVPLS